MNLELATQKKNYESERTQILKEFYNEFQTYEKELYAKESYTNQLKTEFKEKEAQIENEHTEGVVWLNRETKRILVDT